MRTEPRQAEAIPAREAGASNNPSPREQARRTLVVVAVVVPVVLGLLLLGYAAPVFLLIFAGIMLAVFLRGISDWVSAHTLLGGGWSLALVVIVLAAVIGLACWFLAGQVADQVDQFLETLPKAVARAEQQLERHEWGRRLLQEIPTGTGSSPGLGQIWQRVTGFFSTTLGVITDIIVILFVGLFLAAAPDLYVKGLVRLLPPARRQRGREVMAAAGEKLRWWMVGQLVSMVEVGLLTGLGLWLLGVPLPLTLGLMTGLLNFIPTFGPLIAAVPTVLIALAVGPWVAVWALILYTAVACFDGYIVQPLVQRRLTSLPPALLIAFQIVMGVLTGPLGLALATPLLAVSLVFVQKLYVQDVLEGPPAGSDGRSA